MENRVDLNDTLAGMREEHTPVTNPEAKAVWLPDALDVACACFCEPLDAGDDAVPRSGINVPKVAEHPS